MNEKYIPLYRKYRPQKLEEIVGQEHIKKALTNSIELNKISHAYLFTGPRGTGKTSTARIFAKSLNCKEGPTVSPCGTCENCVDITNSTPMDVIEIDAASYGRVEDARNILEKVMYAPVNSKYKIYIIDEVHMLTSNAFNALLKTLEEPPENVIFILATTEVHKVLDTIKSRCQRFDFRRITTTDIVNHLRNISDSEKINITDDALATIAKNSAGGMRDSIALLDQISVMSSKEALTSEDINSILGRINFDTLSSLTNKIINSEPQGAIEDLEKIYDSGNEPVQILTNLMDYLKNLLIIKNCRQEIAFELTQANDAQIKVLNEQAEKIETHQIVFLIEKCADYIKELKLTNNPRLWLEVSIIDLANLAENTKLIELQNRISRLEGGNVQPVNVAQYKTAPAPVLKQEVKSSPKAEPLKTVTPPIHNKLEEKQEPIKSGQEQTNNETQVEAKEDFAPMPKAKPVSGTDIQTLWGQLLDNVQSAPTRALLKQWAVPILITQESVVLTMKNEVLLKQFVEGNKKQMLQSAVDAMFGQKDSKVIVRLPQASDKDIVQEPVQLPKPKAASRPLEVEAVKEDEPEAEEAAEMLEEVKKSAPDEAKSIDKALSSLHSDNVNMVMDVFDGKVID